MTRRDGLPIGFLATWRLTGAVTNTSGSPGATLPRFMPLLEEDAFVEPDVPYLAWLQAASHKRDLKWLIAQFEHSDLSPTLKSEIFGSLELPIRWSLADCNATRTHAQRRTRTIFFHRENLIQRRDVSLASELAKPPLKLNRVSVREGQTIITMCREATSVRYRELYGTTRGDTSDVVRADVGRGVEIFLWGLPANKRLPLRAYQAGFTLKNGRPINYIEAISLFECMEIGFNTFYAYRDGETAWIYAQVLRALHRRLGVKCISVYPGYQIGKDDEEALASGAFWFYGNSDSAPVKRELEHLAKREEAKIAAETGYRTPLRTLRRLRGGSCRLRTTRCRPGRFGTIFACGPLESNCNGSGRFDMYSVTTKRSQRGRLVAWGLSLPSPTQRNALKTTSLCFSE